MEKNSANYKAAQNIANNLTSAAGVTRNAHMMWESNGDAIGHFCEKVARLGGFAAEVAKSVDATVLKGFTAARISSKQAWILACAAVENDIEF